MVYYVHFGRLGQDESVHNAPPYLEHVGTKTHSGRFAWGSGKRPFQRLEKSMKKKHDTLSQKLESRVKASVDKQKYKEIKRNARDMKTEDIRAMIERLKLEREMKDLIDQNLAPKRSTFSDSFGKAVKKAGTQAIENAGRDVMTKTLYWGYATMLNEDGDNKKFPTLSEYLFNVKPDINSKSYDYDTLKKELSTALKGMKMDKATADEIVRNTVNRAKIDATLSGMNMDKDARKSVLDDIFKTGKSEPEKKKRKTN